MHERKSDVDLVEVSNSSLGSRLKRGYLRMLLVLTCSLI